MVHAMHRLGEKDKYEKPIAMAITTMAVEVEAVDAITLVAVEVEAVDAAMVDELMVPITLTPSILP